MCQDSTARLHTEVLVSQPCSTPTLAVSRRERVLPLLLGTIMPTACAPPPGPAAADATKSEAAQSGPAAADGAAAAPQQHAQTHSHHHQQHQHQGALPAVATGRQEGGVDQSGVEWWLSSVATGADTAVGRWILEALQVHHIDMI